MLHVVSLLVFIRVTAISPIRSSLLLQHFTARVVIIVVLATLFILHLVLIGLVGSIIVSFLDAAC